MTYISYENAAYMYMDIAYYVDLLKAVHCDQAANILTQPSL